MPGLPLACKAFATPGIKSLLAKRPDIQRRVARANMVSAIRIQSGSKAKSPVATGRMKTSISIVQLDDVGLELSIGTNVVSKTGFVYPRRQEYDTKLHHTTGEWGFFRKSLAAEKDKHAEQCRKALVNGMKGYA
jgi:hypothetical protein